MKVAIGVLAHGAKSGDFAFPRPLSQWLNVGPKLLREDERFGLQPVVEELQRLELLIVDRVASQHARSESDEDALRAHLIEYALLPARQKWDPRKGPFENFLSKIAAHEANIWVRRHKLPPSQEGETWQDREVAGGFLRVMAEVRRDWRSSDPEVRRLYDQALERLRQILTARQFLVVYAIRLNGESIEAVARRENVRYQAIQNRVTHARRKIDRDDIVQTLGRRLEAALHEKT